VTKCYPDIFWPEADGFGRPRRVYLYAGKEYLIDVNVSQTFNTIKRKDAFALKKYKSTDFHDLVTDKVSRVFAKCAYI
jgi:hypothetical protein